MAMFEDPLDYIMIFSIPECNLFCRYCRQAERRSRDILSNEEILELGAACYDAGIRRIRWSGGEPTVRKGFVNLVSGAKERGIEDQYLSTNGTLLHRMARDLRIAGIRRVNISLDTFNRSRFQKLTGKDLLDEVLLSIEIAAKEFELVKINSVLITEDVADVHDFILFVSRFGGNPPIPRFIPLGGCGRPVDPDDAKKLLQPAQILADFSERYGEIEPFGGVENNNPFIQHYLIRKNGVVFGVVFPVSSDGKSIPKTSKTLRINPNGFVSNDLYSQNIFYLPELDYDGKVGLLKELIEDKKTHDEEWYREAIKKPQRRNVDFWRFGKTDS